MCDRDLLKVNLVPEIRTKPKSNTTGIKLVTGIANETV